MPSVEASPVGKPRATAIPVQFSALEFTAFILPPLSRPKRGPQCKIGYHKPFPYLLKVLYTGMQWQELPIDPPERKAELPYTGVFQLFTRWVADGSLERAFLASVPPSTRPSSSTSPCSTATARTRGQNRGAGIGYSGHKHQKGEQVLALSDNQGHVLSPLMGAPVNEVDMPLLPQGLKALTHVAREVGLDLRGAVLTLDAGFDSKATRKAVFNAGLKPNINENPRNRQKPKRGRKRFFDVVLYKQRFTVERTFA